MLLALEPDQLQGDLPSGITHSVVSGAIGSQGRPVARYSKGERRNQRPCANCSNTGMSLQHGGSYPMLPRSTASCYSPDIVEG